MNPRLRRGLLYIIVLIFPFIFGLLFTFELIQIPFPTDMARHPSSIAARSPADVPQGAVPIGGLAVVPGEVPSNPIPSDEVSLQRGKILYSIHCQLCHGELGHGDGPLSVYFDRTPQNLTESQISEEFDGAVFLTIHNGFGQMPSLEMNLTPREMWDIVNYVRTLPPQ